MEGIIYKYTNKINGKVYIGQTVNEEQRMCAHKYGYEKCYFHSAIKKYGWENFDYEVIERLDESLLDEREIYWINFYQSFGEKGYNLTQGGDGSRGKKLSDEHKQKLITGKKNKPVSEETRRRMSEALKGKVRSPEHCKHLSESLKGKTPWNKGKSPSEEIKRRISETLKGRPLPDEVKRKMSESHKGLKHSEETKRKMSESHKINI